jgi:Zn-dependent metalloprotease
MPDTTRHVPRLLSPARHAQVRRHFVPPFLLQRVADAPDPIRSALTDGPDPALAARDTLAVDRVLRGARVAGHVVGARAAAAPIGGPRRTISDTGGSTDLPGRTVRAEAAAPVGDVSVNEAYDGLGATHALYAEVYGRDSVDGAGSPLLATVHYGRAYDNAFWDGTRMVFGDGDGQVFGRFTDVLSVIGHELTHGVTQASAGLDYAGQPGALNESVSDVFGALVEQRVRGQDAAHASWLIGEGLFLPSVRGVALRSMKAPGTAFDDPVLGRDPQPATMAGYVDTTDDNGGVHMNSGIPNHAFHLAAVAIGGPAWELPGHVWYRTLTGGSLEADSDFAAFAAATLSTATQLAGAGSAGAQAVGDAWAAVGVVV